MSAESVPRRPYTVSSSSAGRAIEVVIMPDVTPVVFVVDDDVVVLGKRGDFVAPPHRSRACHVPELDILGQPLHGVPCGVPAVLPRVPPLCCDDGLSTNMQRPASVASTPSVPCFWNGCRGRSK